jgi:uncharacterized protein YjiS (DUF1127 family)
MWQSASIGRARTGVRTSAVARRAFGVLLRMRQVMRQRRQLSELPDYLLEDIGLTPAQARREALRAFWDLPRTTFHRW